MKNRAINGLIAQLSNYQILLYSTLTEFTFELVNKAYKYLTSLECNPLKSGNRDYRVPSVVVTVHTLTRLNIRHMGNTPKTNNGK